MERKVVPYMVSILILLAVAGIMQHVSQMTMFVMIAILPVVAMLTRTAVRTQVIRKKAIAATQKIRSAGGIIGEGLMMVLLTVLIAIISPNLALVPALLAEVGLAVWLFSRLALYLLTGFILRTVQGKKTNDMNVIRLRLGRSLLVWSALILVAIVVLATTNLSQVYFVTLGAMLAVYMWAFVLTKSGDDLTKFAVRQAIINRVVAGFLAIDTMFTLYPSGGATDLMPVYVILQVAAFAVLCGWMVRERFQQPAVILVVRLDPSQFGESEPLDVSDTSQ